MTLSKSETQKLNKLEVAIRANSYVRVIIDSVLIVVLLVASTNVKSACMLIVESHNESIELQKAIHKGVNELNAWSSKHIEREAQFENQAELLRRHLKN